jgi:hypothetical protein
MSAFSFQPQQRENRKAIKWMRMALPIEKGGFIPHGKMKGFPGHYRQNLLEERGNGFMLKYMVLEKYYAYREVY